MDQILINIIDPNGQKHTIKTDCNKDLSLMEIVKNAGFPMGNCGGMALCASCHCSITALNELNSKSQEEEDMLSQLHNSHLDSRLICQIPLTKELDGITVTIILD